MPFYLRYNEKKSYTAKYVRIIKSIQATYSFIKVANDLLCLDTCTRKEKNCFGMCGALSLEPYTEQCYCPKGMYLNSTDGQTCIGQLLFFSTNLQACLWGILEMCPTNTCPNAFCLKASFLNGRLPECDSFQKMVRMCFDQKLSIRANVRL